MVQDGWAETKKLAIVRQAFERFYEGGFHATGVDAILADSGISKRTLYKYFSSKEQLIEAVLDHYIAGIVRELFEPVMAVSDDARDQILAFFDVRKALIDESPTRGCLGIKASQEFAGKHGGIFAKARQAAVAVEDRFVDLCEKAGLPDPQSLGRQINLLFQGALLVTQALGNSSPFVEAKAAVSTLLGPSGVRGIAHSE